MKKLLLSLLMLFSLTFVFTSCQINWFENAIYVPWWVFLILILTIIAISLIIILTFICSKYRTCTNCEHRFKPKWYRSFLAIFVAEKNGSCDSRLFKCPKCKHKGLMPVSYDQNNRNEENGDTQ